MRLTAQYTTERHQFDKPIATFQAVDSAPPTPTSTPRVSASTAWQAVWRLSEDLPASAEVAVAKFWPTTVLSASCTPPSTSTAAWGSTATIPCTATYLLVKHLALTLGGATTSLLRLGEILASEPV